MSPTPRMHGHHILPSIRSSAGTAIHLVKDYVCKNRAASAQNSRSHYAPCARSSAHGLSLWLTESGEPPPRVPWIRQHTWNKRQRHCADFARPVCKTAYADSPRVSVGMCGQPVASHPSPFIKGWSVGGLDYSILIRSSQQSRGWPKNYYERRLEQPPRAGLVC